MWKAWNETVTPLKEMTNDFIIRGIKSSIANYISDYFQFVKYGFSSPDACDELCTVSDVGQSCLVFTVEFYDAMKLFSGEIMFYTNVP